MGMTTDQLLIFAILGLALLLFIWGRWRYDLVAIMALLVATISGVVPWGEAFTGFAHPAVVTVGAILIVSRSLLNSGIVDLIQNSITSPKDSRVRQVRSLTGLVAILSGFMNKFSSSSIFCNKLKAMSIPSILIFKSRCIRIIFSISFILS